MSASTKPRKLIDAALRASATGALSVSLDVRRGGHTRFANNGVTTTGDETSMEMSVESLQGQRAAGVRGSVRTADDARDLVAQAEALAAIAPVDPERMPLLGAQRYARVRGEDRATAVMEAEARVKLIRPAVEKTRAAGLVGAGFCTHERRESYLFNTAGLRATHRSTSVFFSMTARTTDGTGSSYGAVTTHRAGTLDVAAMADRVVERSRRSANPVSAEARRRTVVLEPLAVADLLSFFTGSMSRRYADEGRSYFAGEGGETKLGQTLFAPSISLRSRPLDPQHPTRPFDGEGSPLSDVTWIESGTLRALPTSRYWARERGLTPLPGPTTVYLDGGKGTTEELMRDVSDGVLVTRFWYNRSLDRSKLQVTGLTRDGTFEIRDGAIARSINNFRYNDSPVTLLTRVVAMGAPVRVGNRRGGVVVVPPMVVEGFNFSSTSEAV